MSPVRINELGGMFGGLLHVVCFTGNTGMVRSLLKKGVNVNSIGSCGSALRAASLGGHNDIVSLLLNQGATLGTDQQNALEACALRNRLSTMYLLVAHLKKTCGDTGSRRWFNAALRTARLKGHTDIIECLATSGLELNPEFLDQYEEYMETVRIGRHRALYLDVGSFDTTWASRLFTNYRRPGRHRQRFYKHLSAEPNYATGSE